MELSSAERKNGQGLQTVQRVTAVVEMCAQQPDRIEAGCRATVIGLPKSTVHRLFQQLCREGYLTHPCGHGPYGASWRLVRVAPQVTGGLTVRSRARPPLEELAFALAANTALAVASEGRSVCIDSVAQPGDPWLHVQVGRMLPVHASAPAKVLAAHLPAAGLTAGVDLAAPATGQTRTGRAALQAEFAHVQTTGDEEPQAGVRAIAVPVWGGDQRVVAAIAVLRSRASLCRSQWSDVLVALRRAAAAITISLGGIPPRPAAEGGVVT